MELSWGKITKRIAEMISAGKFLSDADRAAMPDYEIGRLAREIHSFFYDTPDGYPKPFSQNPIGSYWEGVQEVAEQLTDPARVEEIYQTMMLPLWEITAQDDRYYESRKTGLENMQAYRAGTYSVFNLAQTLRPLTPGTEPPALTAEPPSSELREIPVEEKQTDPYHDLAAGLLHFYQEYDPYDYRDNMELGDTDADALESLEQQLHDAEKRKGILDTLQSYLDNTDPEDEIAADLELFMEQLQELAQEPATNDELEEAKQLINEYCMEVFEQEADFPISAMWIWRSAPLPTVSTR